jgi:signal transduction histidine kinase
MEQNEAAPSRTRGLRAAVPPGFRALVDTLLAETRRDDSRAGVLRRICISLLRFSASDALSLVIDEEGATTRCGARLPDDGFGRIEAGVEIGGPSTDPSQNATGGLVPAPILRAILAGNVAAPAESCTRGGSFWTGDTARPILLRDPLEGGVSGRTVILGGPYPSLAVLRVPIDRQASGVLTLASRRRDFFTADDILTFETVAQTLGVALAHQGAQWALRERVKELTCLYSILTLAERHGLGLDELLQGIVALLPPAWQAPESTSARIVLDGRCYETGSVEDRPHRLAANILVNDQIRGSVEVLCGVPFLEEERHLIKSVAETVGQLVSRRRAEWALRERVKELTCLYGIAGVANRPGLDLDQCFEEIVALLPPAWQYPELTEGRIVVDGRAFVTTGFREAPDRLSAAIRASGQVRGGVEVIYVERTPEMDRDPFLDEERSLIDEVARQAGLILEQREAEAETSRLQEQLRHAERLATVGQLSAGVAHELNEPLAAVLGFAELVKASPALPDAAEADVDRIIKAALYAREIIRKLLIFTRQMPTSMVACDLSQIVRDGLFFLEARCRTQGIALTRCLEEDLPLVMADPSQVQQALVNLVVNAAQAMPAGGALTVSTRSEPDRVLLSVEDTGAGMTPEVQRQLFTPFFTTKDVGQGTGLGLAVVHGIVTAHGGTVNVRSTAGAGSTFEIALPLDRQVPAVEAR